MKIVFPYLHPESLQLLLQIIKAHTILLLRDTLTCYISVRYTFSILL